MSKWIKVDPATLKVGDEVKAAIGNVSTIGGVIDYVRDDHLSIGTVPVSFRTWPTTWYVRKPKKAKRASVDCLNCDGQQCMACALRHWHDDCRMDCPDCSGDTTPEPPPPTRPEEPPVGSFFRVDRSGDMYRAYGPIGPDRCYLGIGSGTGGAQRLWSDWEQLTEPGDTWTLLELREVGQ